MYLCRNDCNFRAYCKFGKSDFAKINLFFILDPEPRKFLNKAKGRHFKQDFYMSYTERIILVYFFHICDMQQDMKIYNYVVY